MKKQFVAPILLFLLVVEAGAQDISRWTQQFESYHANWNRTKIHLVFNQDTYSPGDTAWFKAYHLTPLLTPVPGKQLIDVHLVNSQGESQRHIRIHVNEGKGRNQLLIPNDTPAGIYSVIARGSWINNLNDLPGFSREIVIVSGKFVAPIERRQSKVIPEGGQLIRTVPNKIVVLTYKPLCTINLIDSAGRIINSATTDLNGVASLVFTPEINNAYQIKIVGDSTLTPLPKIAEDGCSMLLFPAHDGNPLRIQLMSPERSRYRNKPLTIIVSSREKVIHAETFQQNGKEAVELQIDQQPLPHGISHVSLLDHTGQLLASRDFYTEETNHVVAHTQPSKAAYKTREKVKLAVSLVESNGRQVKGEFSIRVLNAALFPERKQNLFNDEINTVSNLKDRFLIDRSDRDWFENVDNYLIASTDKVPWENIPPMNGRKPFTRFTDKVHKTGRAYIANTMEPVPDLTQIMIYLQRNIFLHQTSTGENGRFNIILPDIFHEDEFFYLAETRKGKEIKDIKVVWEDSDIKFPASTDSRETDKRDRYAAYARRKKLINDSYRFYTSPTATENEGDDVGRIDFEDEIMGADITVNVQDIVLLPTMEDLVREAIPSLYHRKTRSGSIVRVNLSESMMRMVTGDPVFIIDGIATKNTNFFLSLKPADLLTVKIVKDPIKLSRFGLMGKNGIVIVNTKRGDVREPIDDPGKIYSGISMPADFRSPDYSSPNDPRRPDFRSTIYWHPSIETDAQGKAIVEFFCSDDVGDLQIFIEGLTNTGKPFTATMVLEVSVGE